MYWGLFWSASTTDSCNVWVNWKDHHWSSQHPCNCDKNEWKESNKSQRVPFLFFGDVWVSPNVHSEKYLEKLVERMDIEDAMNMLTKLTQRLAQKHILCIPWVASHVVNEEVVTVRNRMKNIFENIIHNGMPTAFSTSISAGTYTYLA